MQIAEPTTTTVSGGPPRKSMLSTSQMCGVARMGLAGDDGDLEQLSDFSIDFDLVDDVKVYADYRSAQ